MNSNTYYSVYAFEFGKPEFQIGNYETRFLAFQAALKFKQEHPDHFVAAQKIVYLGSVELNDMDFKR